MSPPSGSGDQPDIGVVTPDIFFTFADAMKNNSTEFRDRTAAARSAQPGTPGVLSGSPALIQQLNDAATQRVTYLDATTIGVEGYEGSITAVGNEHRRLHSATTLLMRGILTVHSSKDGGN
ncbi:hypothetical protein AB0E69_15260 [Kribbella sp. NPDC026611]|uniref:hypothetical protein n=1 Tax=Kribbella sp. NPDC026611 TaxID=3154911 RepID=UPI0033F5E6FC